MNRKTAGIIALAAVVLTAGGFILLRGTRDEAAASGGAASSSVLGPSGPPKVTLTLPADRAFPPLSDDICLHLVAGTGMFSGRKGADGKAQAANVNEPVVEWHDLSPLGNNNLMRAFQKSATHAPTRALWPAEPNVQGAKVNRTVLDFRPREGKAIAMNLTEVADQAEKFPFGSAATKGEKGLTLALAFQADAARLPTRILTLSADGNISVSLAVDAQRRLTAEVRNGASTATLTGKDVDATRPCVAVFSWQAGTGQIELRARDAFNKTFKTGGAKVAAPGKPLVRLQLGKVQDTGTKNVPAAEQFAGYLADVILYASWLKNDQIQLLESKALRDYYFQVPPAPPKK